MKRSRGRGRRQQNPVNRSYDSNGPDVRVRGTASQVYEKYQALARDAMSSGDRVMAENYGQHAEHYYRIMLSFQPAPGEGDKDTNGAANGATNGDASGDTTGEDADTDNNGEPLVLVRENANDGTNDNTNDRADDKPAKPSRRRGPLRKKKAADEPASDAADANAGADADAVGEASVVRDASVETPADGEAAVAD